MVLAGETGRAQGGRRKAPEGPVEEVFRGRRGRIIRASPSPSLFGCSTPSQPR